MKRLSLLLSVALIVLVSLTSCVGTYFVNYALKRQVLDPSVFIIDESQELNDFQKRQVENGKIVDAHTKAFAESVEFERWIVTTDDGLELIGNFYPNGESHRYAIVVHGYTSQKEHMLSYGAYFYDWGFNVLATDHRGHGESEGEWIGMGLPDSYDQIKWINTIVERDPLAEITMLGVSMGGATVMMVSGQDLPDNVKCLVEDCGYSSTYEEFAGQLKSLFHLGPEPVLSWADQASVRMAGYSIKEASPVDFLPNAKIPMLFIHGTADSFVPYSMLDENLEAYGGPYMEVLRMEGASHGVSLTVDPELYTSTVHDFVMKFID